MLINQKRAQVWSLDLLIALMIFVIGLLILYSFILNYQSSTFNEISELYYNADISSNILLSDGVSGIVTEGKIDQIKLDNFDSLSDSVKRAQLGISNNIYFSIPNMTVDGSPKEKVGIINTSLTENEIKLTRIILYKNKITKMEIISWS